MSNGATFGVEAMPSVEMDAFDSLPPDVRALLNDTPLNYSAVHIARATPGGMRQIGLVFIEEPDERGALIDAIVKDVQKLPPPLKPLKPYQPTVAERRALKRGLGRKRKRP